MPKSKKFVKAQKCMLSEKNSSTFKYISDLFQYCTGKEQKFQIFQYIQVHSSTGGHPVLYTSGVINILTIFGMKGFFTSKLSLNCDIERVQMMILQIKRDSERKARNIKIH